jgi:hypothetical protein
MGKKSKIAKISGIVRAEVTDGVEWLAGLKEQDFRDQALGELFSKMAREGTILACKNVHGRNEHGIDWLVQEKGALSTRWVGIQAKSVNISVDGKSGREAASQVIAQCQRAYKVYFQVDGSKVRLDNVEVWLSSHITEDAELEFNAELESHKVTVRRANYVFSLINKYCPRLSGSIPGLSLFSYLHKFVDPMPLPIRILGCQLNPKSHFIEPRFSKNSSMSPGRVLKDKHGKFVEEKAIYLNNLLEEPGHLMIVGPELCGKSYLLQRIACLISGDGTIPIIDSGQALNQDCPKDLVLLMHRHLRWLTQSELKRPMELKREIVVLIDNADQLTEAQLLGLCASCPEGVRIICTSRAPHVEKLFSVFYFSGVVSSSIERFVRNLDIEEKGRVAFTDRATSFITRTIHTSGLPINPFTVSAMLRECALGQGRLATPTMGRLIERFVEDQTGSHLDTTRVDYETKMQFLTDIGGRNAQRFKADSFERRVMSFLAKHGHPHSKEDFLLDILEGGIIDVDPKNEFYAWGHRIFREYFWIKNLVREKRLDPIQERLLCAPAVGMAAITGSQLANAHVLIESLMNVLKQQDWMNGKESLLPAVGTEDTQFLLPNDEVEGQMLADVEERALGQGNLDAAIRPQNEAQVEEDEEEQRNRWSTTAARITEEKHFVIASLAALLVNSRNLTLEDKKEAATSIIRSNQRMAFHIEHFLRSQASKKPNELILQFLGLFWQFAMNDVMLGDTFLIEPLKRIVSSKTLTSIHLPALDLLICCCAEEPTAYLNYLRLERRPHEILAVYFRLVMTYYFRCHHKSERAHIREVLKDIRRLKAPVALPDV